MDLMNEFARLQSFQNWPVSHIVTPENLAKSGFYSLKQGDRTRCAFCEGIVGEWEAGDDPDTEHMRHFPNCPFVRTVIQPRLRGVNLGPNVNFDRASREELGINLHTGPRHREYVTIESRLSTFTTWPESLNQTPKALAEAGFYYLGYEDAVECFSCGGCFKEWEPEDDPWREHARWFSRCNYLLLVKGHEFVKECGVGRKISKNMQTANRSGNSNSQRDKFENQVTNPTGNSVKTNPPGEKQNDLGKETPLCKVCMNNEVGVVFLPCGHLVVCVECAVNLTICPICRSTIKGTVRTFLS